MIRKISILLRSDLQVVVTSKLTGTFQKSFYSDTGKKDDSGNIQVTTLPVSECTNRDFSQPPDQCPPLAKKPHCRKAEPLVITPKECKFSSEPIIYDETCDRGYVNPCKPHHIPECMPITSLVNCRFQKCGQASLMDTLPLPDDPLSQINEREVLKTRIAFLLSLLLATGLIYKLWALGLLTDEPPPPKKVAKRKSRRPQIITKRPSDSSDIPDKVPYLLIGGGAASFSAFRAIKTADATAKVLMITKEPYDPYMRPPLSKEMFYDENRTSVVNRLAYTQPNGMEQSIFFEDQQFYMPCEKLTEEPNGGVAVAQGWSVKQIDAIKKVAILEDGKEIKYDKCLLAVGSKPKNIPALMNLNDEVQERVTLYRDVFDFEELEGIIASGAKSIAIVGGGFLGSELACSLARRGRQQGMKVTQIYPEESNLERILPGYLSKWTKKMIEQEGVEILPQTKVEYAYVEDEDLKLLLNNGNILTADQVIVAVGAEPNTELAGPSNLEVDKCGSGGFVTNAELEVRSGLYAAGDCACFFDQVYGRRTTAHHDNAIVTGRLAGENMALASKKPYSDHTMFWSDLGPNITFEAIGVIDPSLPTVGIYAKTDEPVAVTELPVGKTEQSGHEQPAPIEDEDVEQCEEEDEDEDEDEEEECEEMSVGLGEEVECEDEETMEEEELEECEDEPRPLTETCDAELAENEAEDITFAHDSDEPDLKYTKGVLFYLKDDIVVGVVLWNLFNKLSLAKKVLRDKKKYDDLNEVAKLFSLHA